MLENICRTAAELRQTGTVTDGKQQWRTVQVKITITDFSQRDIAHFGAIQSGKIILLAPPDIPKLPAQIAVNEKVYDIKSVKVCRDLNGKLVGCRLAVV